MVAPALVDDLEHDVTLDGTCHLLAAWQLFWSSLVVLECLGDDRFDQLTLCAGLREIGDRELCRVELLDLGNKLLEVPLLGIIRGGRRHHR